MQSETLHSDGGLSFEIYSCTHAIIHSCTHAIVYSCTHAIIYSPALPKNIVLRYYVARDYGQQSLNSEIKGGYIIKQTLQLPFKCMNNYLVLPCLYTTYIPQ